MLKNYLKCKLLPDSNTGYVCSLVGYGCSFYIPNCIFFALPKLPLLLLM